MATFPTTFTLDPTLPWLCSDPSMQEPAALRNMRLLTVPAYEPMNLYFPAGAQLAMRLVTDLDQLTVGAAYWSEMDWTEAGKETVTNWAFGRYAGLAYPESRSTKSRWKKGEAHITFEVDTLDCPKPLREYFLQEDGTETRFVDTKGSYRKTTGKGASRLYQLTHYVSLPAQQLATLGTAAVKQTGLTLRQAVWLEQEKLIAKGGNEITACVTGGQHSPIYRVVLPDTQALHDFQECWSSLLPFILTPGQARKCKSGTVALTTRTTTADGRAYGDTEHYKLADVAPLLEWLRLHSEVQRLKVEAAICAQQMGHRAEALRAERRAFLAQWKAERARKAAEQEQGTPQNLHPDYASLSELAHAA
jgi:hypothetical protein